MKLSKYKAIPKKTQGKHIFGGRNAQGRITVRHQGGGHKQLYRTLDWTRNGLEQGFITEIEQDPNRTAYIAKIYTPNNNLIKDSLLYGSKQKLENIKTNNETFFYNIATKGVKIFDPIISTKDQSQNLFLKVGDIAPLSRFEPGVLIHSVEAIPGQGAMYAKSAGTFCQVLQHSSKEYAKIKLPSGSIRLISLKCTGTLGSVSKGEHNLRNLLKAGRSRWMNKRPSVRGVAMNPVDHPHGGGQGKTKGGRPSVTPWSRITKGQPTRKRKKVNKFILSARIKK